MKIAQNPICTVIKEKTCFYVIENTWVNYLSAALIILTLALCLGNAIIPAAILFVPAAALVIMKKSTLYYRLKEFTDEGYTLREDGSRLSFRSPKIYQALPAGDKRT